MKLRPLFLVCVMTILLPRGGFTAQIFEGLPDPLLQYNPSVRSTAMGGASGAVFWGAAPNDWANPALLGTAAGIRYEDALEQYPYPFDIRFTARREVIGYGGLGIALAGRPFEGMGGTSWEGRGLSGTDWEAIERRRSWSAGISTSRIAETAASALHRRVPTITRHVDLAYGYTHKAGGGDEGPINDWGLLGRVGGPISLRGVPIEIEAAYGYSVLNTNRAPDRHMRNSVGLHAAAGRLPEGFAGLPAWFRSGLEPLVSAGGAFDGDRRDGGYYSHLWGGELAVANVLFLRLGRNAAYVTDHEDFRGFGIALPLGTFAGARYDNARAEGELLSDIEYRAWSAWVNPLALLRAWR